MEDNNDQSINNFAAIKTTIANNEEQRLKELLAGQVMQELEKSYLIDLAKIGNNHAILKILEDIPVENQEQQWAWLLPEPWQKQSTSIYLSASGQRLLNCSAILPFESNIVHLASKSTMRPRSIKY